MSEVQKKKPAGMRRTQQERRETMQQTLLEATLRCLGRRGYASTSISEIIKEGGVSRGALLHHYPTKVDLVAAAIDHFYQERLNRFQERLLGADSANLSLRQRLEVLRIDFRTWFPIGFEIIVAVRTNKDLQKAYHDLAKDRFEPMSQIYEKLFPEFATAKSPRLMISIVGTFLRGLCLEDITDDEGQADAVFNQFVEVLEFYYHHALRLQA